MFTKAIKINLNIKEIDRPYRHQVITEEKNSLKNMINMKKLLNRFEKINGSKRLLVNVISFL